MSGYIGLNLYTVGNVEALSKVYTYLNLILNDQNFIEHFIQITAIWGLLFAILASVFQGRFHSWIYHFFASYFIFQIFFMPIVDLTIIDTKVGQQTVVQNVPFGVGFIASLASTFSYEITNEIDDAFNQVGPVVVWGPGTGSYVANVNYSTMGYGGLFDYLKMGLQIDPKLVETQFGAIYEMQSYIEQCFFPYVATLNQSQLQQIESSQNLLQAIQVNASFLMNYDGQTWTCDNFYNQALQPDWTNFINNVVNTPQLLGFANYMTTDIQNSFYAMTNASLSFNQILTQSSIINLMKEAYFTSGLGKDMNNRILAGYIAGRAEEQARLYGESMLLWANKAVPLLQDFLEDFFVILFPFLIILIFLPLVSFGGIKAAIGYLKVIAWVYLITPVLAIINALINLQAIDKTITWLNSIGMSGLTLGDYGYLLEQANLYPAVAGAAALSAPLWAWMLLQGFETGVMGMADLVGSMGSQFIGQDAASPNLTSNIARDSREMQASMLSGHTAFGSLSNVGTWMFEQNSNLAGMYSAIGSYQGYSDYENQWGINKLVEAQTDAAIYNQANSFGPAMGAVLASGGNLNTIVNSRAIANGPEIYEKTPFGSVGYTELPNGELVAVDFNPAFKTNGMLDFDKGTTITQSKIDAVEKSYQEKWTHDKSFQDGKRVAESRIYSFIRSHQKSDTITDSSSIDHHGGIEQSLAVGKSLVHSLMSEYGLSEDKAQQFEAKLTTNLEIARKLYGKNLSEKEFDKVYEETAKEEHIDLNKPESGVNVGGGSGGGVGSQGTDTFHNTQSWKNAYNFLRTDAYNKIYKAGTSYDVNHTASHSDTTSTTGSEAHNVSNEDFKAFTKKLDEAHTYISSLKDQESLSDSKYRGVRMNYTNFYYLNRYGLPGGAIHIKDELTDLVHHNKKPIDEDTNNFKDGLKSDIPQDVQHGIDKGKHVKDTVEGTITHAPETLNNTWKKDSGGVEHDQNANGVNPHDSNYGEYESTKAKAERNISGIKHTIATKQGNIKPPKKPPGAVKAKKLFENGNPSNPLVNTLNNLNYGLNNNKGFGLTEFVSWGYNTGGPLGAGIGLDAYIGAEIGTQINNYGGKSIFSNITRPVLNELGKKTGLFPTLTAQEANEVDKKVPWKP